MKKKGKKEEERKHHHTWIVPVILPELVVPRSWWGAKTATPTAAWITARSAVKGAIDLRPSKWGWWGGGGGIGCVNKFVDRTC